MSRVRITIAAEVLLLLGLLTIVAAAFLVERGAGLDGPIALGTVPRLALCALPSLLWLGYFRAQDSQSFRPKNLLVAVYLLGATAAGPAADLLGHLALAPPVAGALELSPLGAERLVTAFLVVAVAQELCIYAVVRYTVYPLPEMDHPIDGLIYMTAAGLGFASYRSFESLSHLGGHVVLSAAAIRVAIDTLAHASFAAVLGLSLGWAKFSPSGVPKGPIRRGLVLLAGLLLAIALNGQFAVVDRAIGIAGLGYVPWRQLAYAFGFAGVVFVGVSLLLRRALVGAAHTVEPT